MWRTIFGRRPRASGPTPEVHRGRIFYDAERRWWCYTCLNCDYGGGSVARSVIDVTWPWLMKSASDHADPQHWSRRRRG